MRIFRVLAVCLLPAIAAAQPIQFLHQFTPSPASPNGALTRLPDGTLCGVVFGGVYCLAPGGPMTVTPGPLAPAGALVRGPDGALYGTTRDFVAAGSVFRFDAATGQTRTVHILDGANEGSVLLGGLVEAGGLLYGVTRDGGDRTYGYGTLFSVNPVSGEYRPLHIFSEGLPAGARLPTGPLALGPDGRLYGVTRFGTDQENGAVYRYDPASGLFAIVHELTTAEGVGPVGPLALDVDGMFYGASAGGTIFRFDPATNAVTVLYTFHGTDGIQPGPVTIGPDGHLYGTTAYGSQIGAPPTVFRLRRLAGPAYAFDTLATLEAQPADSLPLALTAGADGRMYGYTTSGGPAASGTLFRFDLPPAGPPPGPVPLTVVHDFRPTTAFDPSVPASANDGLLYGTTLGGSTRGGAVYRMDPATGATTIVGDIPGPIAGASRIANSQLVPGADGLLYGTSSSSTATAFQNRVLRVDPATGAATAAVTTGGSLSTQEVDYNFYSPLVRTPGGTLYGLRYERTGTHVFRFDPQANTVTDVAASTLTQVSGLLASSDGQLYVGTVRSFLGGGGRIPFLLYDADLQRVNLATSEFESVAVLARATPLSFDVGTPVDGPQGSLYVATTNSGQGGVFRVHLSDGAVTPLCGVGTSSGDLDLAVTPAGAVVGASAPIGPATLVRCTPQSVIADVQRLPPAVRRAISPLAFIGGAIYGASGIASGTGGAIFRVAGDDPLPALDSEGDGLPNTWETAYGLDPFSGAGDDGASGDPDHDGRTNAQELADGTHPRGFFTRYFAEGASNAFFQTRFDLVDPHESTPAIVRVRWLTDAGVTVRHDLVVDPGSHVSLDPATVPGLEHASFSTVIESDALLAADRLMQWGEGGYGSSLETSVAGIATTWYFAEGSTSGDFALFYLLQNPQSTAVSATVRYLLPLGQAPIEKTYQLPPFSRTTIVVDAEGPGLASTDVSAVVTATAPIVAERAMYFSRPGRPFLAGHASAGVTAPSLDWFFAEGSTGPFFDLFVLLSNPGSTASTVEVEYLLQSGGSLTKSYVVPANSRLTIWVDDEQLPAGSGQRPLADVAVSMRVHATNGVPIVAERTMWWPGPAVSADFWYEAHNSPGATATATRWAIGGGDARPAAGTETYVLIANPSATPARARVSVYATVGSGVTRQTYALPPKSRTTIALSDVGAFQGSRAGAVVESLGVDPVPIVVERASYASPGGVAWSAGGAALAEPLP